MFILQLREKVNKRESRYSIKNKVILSWLSIQILKKLRVTETQPDVNIKRYLNCELFQIHACSTCLDLNDDQKREFFGNEYVYCA